MYKKTKNKKKFISFFAFNGFHIVCLFARSLVIGLKRTETEPMATKQRKNVVIFVYILPNIPIEKSTRQETFTLKSIPNQHRQAANSCHRHPHHQQQQL